jgi:hypothetical protein
MSDSSRHDWHIIICNGQGGFTSQERYFPGISMCACARVIRCTISFKLEMAGQILLLLLSKYQHVIAAQSFVTT